MSRMQQKNIVTELYNEGLSYQEIADRVGTSAKSVRTICVREREKEKRGYLVERYCQNCGKALVYKRGTRGIHFCSDQCRGEHHYRMMGRKIAALG